MLDDEYKSCLQRVTDARIAGDHEVALQLLAGFIRDDPDEAGFHSLSGHVYLELQKPREAAASFHQAVALDPFSFPSWQGLVYAFSDVGDYDQALAAIRHCLSLERTPLALEQASFLLGKCNQMEAAIDLGLEALEHDPRNVPLMTRAGVWCVLLDRDDLARSLFVRAIDVDPNAARALAELGFMEYAFGDINDSLDLLGRAVEADPDCAQAHYYSAYSLQQIGAMKAAAEEYRIAKRLKPSIESAEDDARFL